MAQDPVSHTAAWLSSTRPDSNAEDPVLGMIAEYQRVLEFARRAETRAREIKAGLPDDIRSGKVKVAPLGFSDLEEFRTEREIREFFSLCRVAGDVARVAGDDLRPNFDARLERAEAKALEDFKLGLEKVHAALEASGCAALEREAEALNERANKIDEQICRTPASSAEVILWQLHSLRDFCDEGWVDTIIAGVRKFAAARLQT
jgi:hypothetical protein